LDPISVLNFYDSQKVFVNTNITIHNKIHIYDFFSHSTQPVLKMPA